MKNEEKNDVCSLSEKEIIDLLSTSKFEIEQFHQDTLDKTDKALEVLSSKQDNEHPLKKGGEGVVFRQDIIIMKNRQKYNAYENTLFDIFCGYVSSRPDDNHYVIYPKDVMKLVNFADKSYVYKLLKEATETIAKKPLLFDVVLPNGQMQTVAKPWYELLTYSGKNTNEEVSFISFTPSKFFKMLLISATVTHGAFYQIGVSSMIQSKYIRNLFYILESKKTYKENPAAKMGVFRIPLDGTDGFQSLIGYPENYRPTDVRRNILEAGKAEINNLEGCDITFDYEMVKTAVGDERKRFTHIDFFISDKAKVLKIEQKEEEKTLESDIEVIKPMLMAVEMTDSERQAVIAKYQKYNRDITFLTQAIAKVLNSPSVRSKAAVLNHIMENGLTSDTQNATEQSTYKSIEQRQYNFEDLEKQLVNN